jgi:hypothetical protein
MIELIDKSHVGIDGKRYEFKDPTSWTIDEALAIEDDSTIFKGGIPYTSKRLSVKNTIKAAIPKIPESVLERLSAADGYALFGIVSWRAVPLESSPSSSPESGAESPPKSG